MARLLTPFLQAIDGNGNPISGALLYFYQTGTSTPKNTYSDSGLTTPNANPVVADSAGRFGAIYLAQDVDYKAILKDASGTTLQTRDPLLVITTSVIAHQGSLIIGGSLGQDSELVIGAANSTLRSDGTTASWRAPSYTKQVFTSGSGTYTTPANCTAIRVRIVGGGGGGGGTGGTTGPTGAAGGTSSFGTVTVVGGSGGVGAATSNSAAAGGAGGTGGTGTPSFRINGAAGNGNLWAGGAQPIGTSGSGGGSAFFNGGGGAVSGTSGAVTGAAGVTNTGGGGSGAVSAGTTNSGAGGGGGESAEIIISTPAASYSYAVGGGGAGGIGTGTAAATGGAGGSGIVIVEEFYA